MSEFRLRAAAVRGEFEEEFRKIYGDVADAGLASIKEISGIVKTQARADIAKAGFSSKWQNALRVNVYANKGIDAAMYLYHKIFYAGVFEEETKISAKGDNFLWLPLRTTPKRIGTKRMTAKLFNQELGPLQFVKNGGKPLLAGKMAVNSPNDEDVTLNKIRQAYRKTTTRAGSSRRLAGGRVAKDGFETKSQPFFVGVKSVKIPDKFSIAEICGRAANKLAELYIKNFKGD